MRPFKKENLSMKCFIPAMFILLLAGSVSASDVSINPASIYEMKSSIGRIEDMSIKGNEDPRVDLELGKLMENIRKTKKPVFDFPLDQNDPAGPRPDALKGCVSHCTGTGKDKSCWEVCISDD